MRRSPAASGVQAPILPNCPEVQEAEGIMENGQTIETVCVRITDAGTWRARDAIR
jgi:hypothetical protein